MTAPASLPVAVCPTCGRHFLASLHELVDIAAGGIECDGLEPGRGPTHMPARVELRRYEDAGPWADL